MSGDGPARLRRIAMRSWRRGMREMDLILGPFADARLAAMTRPELDLYEALLSEGDPELYRWVTGAAPAPAQYAALVADIAAFARERHSPALERPA